VAALSVSAGSARGAASSASADTPRKAARRGEAGATARSMRVCSAFIATPWDWRWEVDGEELDMSSASWSPASSTMSTSASAVATRTEMMAALETRSFARTAASVSASTSPVAGVDVVGHMAGSRLVLEPLR
jgi:hypothetical protein